MNLPLFFPKKGTPTKEGLTLKLRSYIFSVFVAFFFMIGYGAGPANAETETEANPQLIIINKSINKLAFYEDGKLMKTFPVGTGRKDSYTPEGTFKIVNKIKNRPYFTGKIAGGDPQNPLGDRWLGINARGTWGTTYAIHGNNNANTIGKYVSSGCIRMHNKEVRWLYDQINVDTPVVILKSKLSFDKIAEQNKYTVHAGSDSEVPASAKPKPAPPLTVEKADVTLTLTQDTPLYSKPNHHSKISNMLSPQPIEAYEKAGENWYHVKTWFGDAWLQAERAIVGEITSLPEPKRIPITDLTSLHALPFAETEVLGTIKEQEVTAFEQWNDWYHIHSWLGDVWVKVPGTRHILSKG
jgi:hypothetical protein